MLICTLDPFYPLLSLSLSLQTLSVLNPLQQADASALRNTDLAGPLIFCLMFGGTLLLVTERGEGSRIWMYITFYFPLSLSPL